MKRKPIGLLRPNVRDFIVRYRAKKKYPYSSYICLCEILEILLESPAHHKESILYGTYNNSLELKELMIGYDGESLLEISVYYLTQYIEDKIKHYRR